MSFVEVIPPRPSRPVRSGWRWFPWAVVAVLCVVVTVNGAMAWMALHTFPGIAGRDGFDLSNNYDRVLDVAARQAALGWKLDAGADAAGHASLTLTDRAGAPLDGARIDASAERPLGAPMHTALAFRALGAGRYVAADALPEKGQWDLSVSATVNGRAISVTRRVIVR